MAAPLGLVATLTLTLLVLQIHAAAILPTDSVAEKELEPLTHHPSPASEESLEETLQSPQDTSDTDVLILKDIAQDDSTLEMGDDVGLQATDVSEEELEDLTQEEKSSASQTDESKLMEEDLISSVIKQLKGTPANEQQNDESQENELKDLQLEETDEENDSDAEYEKALQDVGPNEGKQEFDSLDQNENRSQGQDSDLFEDEDYDSYDSDDFDQDRNEITDARPAKTPSAHSLDTAEDEEIPHFPEMTEITEFKLNADEAKAVRPYLDDAIADTEDLHHEDKREDDVMKVPGFPPLRVIELNETIYLNNTEQNSLPRFEPVRIPDKFEDYDVNKDRLISLPELRYVTGATEGAKQAFRDADIDGDGWVDRTEFRLSGWGLPVDSPPPPPPPTSIIFVPRENVRPSNIPRGAEDVSDRRRSGRRYP